MILTPEDTIKNTITLDCLSKTFLRYITEDVKGAIAYMQSQLEQQRIM
jgi:hypothetical protein